MKQKLKEIIMDIILVILFAVLLAALFIYGTSAECWYAGEHDSYCETLLGREECGCYQRLVKEAKENENRQL
jgi:hypothetical protein